MTKLNLENIKEVDFQVFEDLGTKKAIPPFSLMQIKTMFEKGSLMYDSKLQRQVDQWNNDQKTLLIDSLISGVPVLSPIASRFKKEGDKFASYSIMDGKQRISTICQFLGDKFKLTESISPLLVDELMLEELTKEIQETLPDKLDLLNMKLQKELENEEPDTQELENEIKKLEFILNNTESRLIFNKYDENIYFIMKDLKFSELPETISYLISKITISLTAFDDLTHEQANTIFFRYNNGVALNEIQKLKARISEEVLDKTLELSRNDIIDTLGVNSKSQFKNDVQWQVVLQSLMLMDSEFDGYISLSKKDIVKYFIDEVNQSEIIKNIDILSNKMTKLSSLVESIELNEIPSKMMKPIYIPYWLVVISEMKLENIIKLPDLFDDVAYYMIDEETVKSVANKQNIVLNEYEFTNNYEFSEMMLMNTGAGNSSPLKTKNKLILFESLLS